MVKRNGYRFVPQADGQLLAVLVDTKVKHGSVLLG
jgi:hypothetical protein